MSQLLADVAVDVCSQGRSECRRRRLSPLGGDEDVGGFRDVGVDRLFVDQYAAGAVNPEQVQRVLRLGGAAGREKDEQRELFVSSMS